VTIEIVVMIAGLFLNMVAFVVTSLMLYHRGVMWLGERLAHFETRLAEHALQITAAASQLEKHGDRMERYESDLHELVAQFQRVLGRTDLQWRQGDPDRRKRTSS
jgi:hypothetical protein